MGDRDYVTRNEFNQLDKRVGKVEDRTTRNETKIEHIEKALTDIKGNTTWILRLIIGAIVMALLGVIFI